MAKAKETQEQADDRKCECADDQGTSVRDDGSFCRRCGLAK